MSQPEKLLECVGSGLLDYVFRLTDMRLDAHQWINGHERPLTDKASAHTCAHICTLLAERRVQLFRYCTNRMKAASGARLSHVLERTT